MANVTMIPAKTRRGNIEKEEKPKLRVAAYCRVSTDTDEQATSYEAQVEHYTEYIMKNTEWEFAGIYADDGISGTNTKKREEFNRMITDCMDGKVDMIITKSISRFARNTLDCLQYIRKLKDKGIPVFFEKENINTMDAKGELLLTIMASLAQQESQSLSQNVKLGIQFRYQAGKVQVNHNRFLGYTKDKNGNLVIEESEAMVIKRIFREYLEGSSLQEICDGLMQSGILTGAGKERWIPSTVHKILTNEKYIGDALLQKTVTTDFLEKKRVANNGISPQYYVEDNHEPIIPRDIYMRVQEEMIRRANLRSGDEHQKKRIYSSKYALSSICVCEKCGDIYRRVAWNNRGKHSTVWRCCTRMDSGLNVCDAPTINETVLQKAVMTAINEVLGKKSTVIDSLKAILDKGISTEEDDRIHEIDEKMVNIQKELVSRATAKQNYDDLSDEIFRLREEKQKLMAKQAEDSGKRIMREELITYLDEQSGLLEEYNDSLVRKLIERIVIHEDGTFTVEFKSETKITVATMNTADQNVFTLDTAFQRRWDMKMIENDVTKAEHAKTKILDTTVTWEKFNTVVNEQIITSGATTLSSEDKRLGSYFVTEDVLKYFTMETDKNEIAEKYNIDLENGQELERKIKDLNSRFGDKVIKYLWDDVFKFSRDDLFESTYKSLEKVLYDFNRYDGDRRFDIFKQDIKDNLFSGNNIEETRNE